MKLIIVFGFFFHIILAFNFVQQSSIDGNHIWVPFISKDVLAKNDFRKCTINVHLKNKNLADHKSVLKYLNQEMFR
jgi:hypothetical protein